MGYLALYRKYRPDNFNDVVGQKYVLKTLKNEIVNNKISHAYLFYGPRGTGKTTIAKAFAKLVNCLNLNDLNTCEVCDSCLLFNNKNNPDIIEIDAASNNGVDEIRLIRDNVSLLPSVSKYKVYIIDEVHMLSSGAFNALLKTLEEPPKHVIFILATTEFYKVPETIVSRCQTFEFERISEIEIVNKLKEISIKENISIDDDTLFLIAKNSNGGLRDSISMLDKLSSSSDNITIEDYYDLKGYASDLQINDLLKNIYSNSILEVFNILDNFNKEGKNLFSVVDKLIEYFKTCIVNNNDGLNKNFNIDKYYKILDILIETQVNSKNLDNPSVIIQVGILKIMKLLINENSEKIISREIILEKKCIDNTKNVTKSSNIVVEPIKSSNIIDEELKKIIINNALATANKNLKENIKSKWNEFSNYLNDDYYSSVVSYILDADVCVAGENNLILSVMYDSILENVNKSNSIINELFSKVLNNNFNVAFVTNNEWNIIKDKYIKDIKSGIKYTVKVYTKNESDVNLLNSELCEHSDIVDAAIDLFGNDIIELK